MQLHHFRSQVFQKVVSEVIDINRDVRTDGAKILSLCIVIQRSIQSADAETHLDWLDTDDAKFCRISSTEGSFRTGAPESGKAGAAEICRTATSTRHANT